MTQPPRPIELLAPARSLETGREAILHGADAVYIGAEDFGARAAAGNSVDDIAALCDFAAPYGAKVYVTLNTILYDNELRQAERLVRRLWDAGVSALIVQDLALLKLDIPPIPLHASTQTDAATLDKARYLAALGFEQLVLPREFSLRQIRAYHEALPLKLEAFVHGALCVSYSGRCYASQHCFGRSANRGRCAQFCRLAFDLEDAAGRTLMEGKHLLSLRDMNRSADLEAMLNAGVSSLKIEGRLKSTDYVKNVTAYYRQALDEILDRYEDLCRSSHGTTEVSFQPRLEKSFNRGFTDYFLHGRTPVHSFSTPKSIGAPVGTVVASRGKRLQVLTDDKELHAGDGLCYFDADERLHGLRVNRVEGDTVILPKDERVRPGTKLYRNLDYAFARQLEKLTARRTVALDITLEETPEGYALELTDEGGTRCRYEALDADKQDARTPQAEAIRRQLARLGDTPYVLRSLSLRLQGERFIPASRLAEWRRAAVELLLQEAKRKAAEERDERGRLREKLSQAPAPPLPPSLRQLDHTANVSNHLARELLEACGAESIAPAYELEAPASAALMTCRHCIRYAIGQCPKRTGKPSTLKEPLALRLPDGRRFPLRFDCERCEMLVLSSNV